MIHSIKASFFMFHQYQFSTSWALHLPCKLLSQFLCHNALSHPLADSPIFYGGTVTVTMLENVELTDVCGKPTAGAGYTVVSPTRLQACTL